MFVGIYMLEIIMPGKWFGAKYIGQSKDLSKRFREHLNHLRKNKHGNRKLQNFFNKHGESPFKFTILTLCEEKELDFWEKWFIKNFNTFNTKFNFNLTRGGDDGGNKRIKCKLQNIKTGLIDECDSIVEFSHKHNINRSNLTILLNKKRKFVGDWTLPEIYEKLKFHLVISPNGKIIKIYRISKFIKENKLRRGTFYMMLNGKRNTSQGWSRPDSFKKKKYKFQSPDGKIYEVENMRQFALQNNLDDRGFWGLISKKCKVYKGWQLCQV